MILRAKTVLPMGSPPLANAAVAIHGATIAAVGEWPAIERAHPGPVRDLGEVVLLPGLINAHCHLDYTGLAGAVPAAGTFTDWIMCLVALKAGLSDDQYQAAIREGLNQLVQSGTTTVLNIAAVPRVVPRVLDSPIRVIWCFELIDFNRRDEAESLFAELEKFIDGQPGLVGHYGFSPHAPYTASAGLYLLAARAAESRGVILTSHLAESAEEDDMFSCGQGPMYDYFKRAGREMTDCKHGSIIRRLADAGVLSPRLVAAHANHLTRPDVQLLAEHGVHVVHCPKTHRFFDRDAPQLQALWAAGVNICLGTDSLASNDSLNLFHEMHTLAHEIPTLDASRILEMATLAPARALGEVGRLGVLAPGAQADLISVPIENPAEDPYESVVYAAQPVQHVMARGKMIVG